MFAYRLTKYDPRKRDASGRFTAEEWTSVSDIGRKLGGKTVSISDYLEGENAYVESARTMLSAADVTSMRVSDLEQRYRVQPIRFEDKVCESSSQVKDDQAVSGAFLEGLIRGCLREYIWCRLNGPGGAYLHFGHDYYMYVGLPKAADGLTLPRGMFLEEFESPYIRLDD